MRKNIYAFALLLGALLLFPTQKVKAQKVAVKTNLAHWAIGGSPNLALELALSKKSTLELGGGVNFWNLSDNKKTKHWIFQPELRLWTCEAFNGHFFGLHAQGGQFNVGGVDIPVGRLKELKDSRYQGHFYGGGISYGYQTMLSPRWNMEFSIGGGYNRVHYEKYPCTDCGSLLEEDDYNYWGVSKATISLIYIIK